MWTFYIYTLLRFFKFPYIFCGDFRRTCNPRNNYMQFLGYVLQHGDPPHFLWGKNLQCVKKYCFPIYDCTVSVSVGISQKLWPNIEFRFQYWAWLNQKGGFGRTLIQRLQKGWIENPNLLNCVITSTNTRITY